MKRRRTGGPSVPSFRAKSCTGKKRYGSESEAAEMIAIQIEYGKDMADVRPYKCGYCNKWHLGHNMTGKDVT